MAAAKTTPPKKGEPAVAPGSDGGDGGEYKCLVRATDGSKKFSTTVRAQRPAFPASQIHPSQRFALTPTISCAALAKPNSKVPHDVHCSTEGAHCARSAFAFPCDRTRLNSTRDSDVFAGAHGLAQEQEEGKEEAGGKGRCQDDGGEAHCKGIEELQRGPARNTRFACYLNDSTNSPLLHVFYRFWGLWLAGALTMLIHSCWKAAISVSDESAGCYCCTLPLLVGRQGQPETELASTAVLDRVGAASCSHLRPPGLRLCFFCRRWSGRVSTTNQQE